MIPIQEFNAALTELQFQTAQWYQARYEQTCRMCVESPASRQLMLTMLDQLVATLRSGGDFSVPLVVVAGTMLQTGYMIGRRHAEAEVLEGWLRL
jgi:urease accessory protein UreE